MYLKFCKKTWKVPELQGIESAGKLRVFGREERRAIVNRKQNGPRIGTRGPSGGLFGIDQEVVTLSAPLRVYNRPALAILLRA